MKLNDDMKARIDDYFKNVSPEDFLKSLEEVGIELVDNDHPDAMTDEEIDAWTRRRMRFSDGQPIYTRGEIYSLRAIDRMRRMAAGRAAV